MRNFTTIEDLTDAVIDARPDCAPAGVEIGRAHVIAARHERGGRYEDIADADFDAITERAVELAMGEE